MNKSFDLETSAQILQYIFMGNEDDNDTLSSDDAFSDEERTIILKVLGEDMHQRWERSKIVYREKILKLNWLCMMI